MNDKNDSNEPIAAIYKFWKEATYIYQGKPYHVGWPILFVCVLAGLVYISQPTKEDCYMGRTECVRK
jgi:hypothetical protein